MQEGFRLLSYAFTLELFIFKPSLINNLMIKYLITALALAFSISTFAQDYSSAKNTMLNFDVSVDDNVFNNLDSYTPSTTREQNSYKENVKYVRKRLIDLANDFLRKELQEQKGISVEETDAILSQMTYNDFGYPFVLMAKTGIKKVQKKGYESDYYFSFKLNVTAGTDIISTAKLMRKLRPEVTISINTYGSDGKNITKIQGRDRPDEAFKASDFPGDTFDKLENDYMDPLVEKITPILENAVKLAVKNLKVG